MRAVQRRADPGDDSDPCGSDTCPSSFSDHSRPSRTQSSSNTPTLQPSQVGSESPEGGDGTESGHTSGFNKAAIAGIVIGILALILLVGGLWVWLRRRQQAALRAVEANGKAGDMHLASDKPVTIQPASAYQVSPMIAMAEAPGAGGHRQPVTYANLGSSALHHSRSFSDATLPNPHNGSQTLDRSLPPLPPVSPPPDTGIQTLTAGGNSTMKPESSSQPPSTWRASTLSNGMLSDASDSRVSSMFSPLSNAAPSEEAGLLTEMAFYQKRLETHHRKDSEDLVAAAFSRGVPSDPPPSYSPTDDYHTQASRGLGG